MRSCDHGTSCSLLAQFVAKGRDPLPLSVHNPILTPCQDIPGRATRQSNATIFSQSVASAMKHLELRATIHDHAANQSLWVEEVYDSLVFTKIAEGNESQIFKNKEGKWEQWFPAARNERAGVGLILHGSWERSRSLWVRLFIVYVLSWVRSGPHPSSFSLLKTPFSSHPSLWSCICEYAR